MFGSVLLFIQHRRKHEQSEQDNSESNVSPLDDDDGDAVSENSELNNEENIKQDQYPKGYGTHIVNRIDPDEL